MARAPKDIKIKELSDRIGNYRFTTELLPESRHWGDSLASNAAPKHCMTGANSPNWRVIITLMRQQWVIACVAGRTRLGKETAARVADVAVLFFWDQRLNVNLPEDRHFNTCLAQARADSESQPDLMDLLGQVKNRLLELDALMTVAQLADYKEVRSTRGMSKARLSAQLELMGKRLEAAFEDKISALKKQLTEQIDGIVDILAQGKNENTDATPKA